MAIQVPKINPREILKSIISTLTNKQNWKSCLFITLLIIVLVLPAFLMGFVRIFSDRTVKARLETISLPPNFHIDVYSYGIEGAAQIAISTTNPGFVYVGTTTGKVYALVDDNRDNVVDNVVTLVSGFSTSYAVTYFNSSLFLVSLTGVYKFDVIDEQVYTYLNNPNPDQTTNQYYNPSASNIMSDQGFVYSEIYSDLPSEELHKNRYLSVSPRDNKLYISIGAPCNSCNRTSEDPRYGTIIRMNTDGSGVEIFASGIRNSLGMDFHPRTKELWFTDRGRDWMGVNIPADELNYAPDAGYFFGFPVCYGTLPDPQLNKGESAFKCVKGPAFSPPVQNLPSHTAASGLKFYTAEQFPPDYRHSIFIAEFGTLVNVPPTGFRISKVDVDPYTGEAFNYSVFAQGWLQGLFFWGRPTDLAITQDGSMLVSDSYAGQMYRIYYQPPSIETKRTTK